MGRKSLESIQNMRSRSVVVIENLLGEWLADSNGCGQPDHPAFPLPTA